VRPATTHAAQMACAPIVISQAMNMTMSYVIPNNTYCQVNITVTNPNLAVGATYITNATTALYSLVTDQAYKKLYVNGTIGAALALGGSVVANITGVPTGVSTFLWNPASTSNFINVTGIFIVVDTSSSAVKMIAKAAALIAGVAYLAF
jgi:hypothetical protein